MADSLKRPLNPMPSFVRVALTKHHRMDAFHSRPPYQQNDYLGWIARAKRDETKQRRLQQMIDELSQGDTYMNMDWRPESSAR